MVQKEVTTITAHLADYERVRRVAPLQNKRAAERYELSSQPTITSGLQGRFSRSLCRVYLRARQGSEAAVEFGKILAHRGILVASPIGALARLELARAHALAGDRTRAKADYLDFLTLWKEADPDIPVLKQAKAEYGALR